MDLDRHLSQLFARPCTPKSVIRLKGGASSRQYYRVILNSGFEPDRMIVMALPCQAAKSDEITSVDPPDELPFLNMTRYLEQQGIRCPEIYLDAETSGMLFIEDLGDDILLHRVHRSPSAMPNWYAAATELLAKMHDGMWPIPSGCVAGMRTFDFGLARAELDHFREWGLEARLKRTLDPQIRRALDDTFDLLAEEFASLPRGFVHRDYQSTNLLVLGDAPTRENLAIIDHQDAMQGPRIYDLVALLNDSYVDVPGTLKDEMLALYAAHRQLEESALKREFHLVTVQRKLKDGGRFVFIDRTKGDSSFLPFVERSFALVRSSLAELSGHDELKVALSRAGFGEV